MFMTTRTARFCICGYNDNYVVMVMARCRLWLTMVKLTVDLIARRTTGFTKKSRDESVSHYLRRITHLYLEDKGIDEIVRINIC